MRIVQTDLSLQGHGIHRVANAQTEGDAATWQQAYQSKSISILSPLASDSITLWITNTEIEILEVIALRRDGTVLTYNIKYGDADRSNSVFVVNGGSTVDDTFSGAVLAAGTPQTVPADKALWLEVASMTGAVTELHLTLYYRVK